MRVGYARVSGESQDHALQLDALREAGCERIIEETASGAKTDRPQLAMLLNMMREGDVLVVWKLDRLSRSMRQLIETVDDLNKRGIGLKCLTQDIDTTTPGGRLVFGVFAAIAEFERAMIIERTKAGMAAAIKRGVKVGRKKSLSKIEVEGVMARIAQGWTLTDTARELGVHRQTIARYVEERSIQNAT